MPHILVVCTANVCRSPLAALRLRELLGDAGLAGSVHVSSAGSAAAGDRGICSRVHDRFRDEPGNSLAASEHLSRRLTEDMLEGADLVLVPDLANRARVVALRPSVRGRTMLLRDAAAHAPSAPAREGSASARAAEPPSASALSSANEAFAAWVGALRTARLTAPHITSHRFSFRSHAARDLEIADGHNLGMRRHRQTLEAVEASVSTLALSLAGLEPLRRFGPHP